MARTKRLPSPALLEPWMERLRTQPVIKLQAVNPERNVYRAYEVHLTRGLFNLWMVQIGYGRLGSRGHTHSHSFETHHEALAFIAKSLKRRQSAPRRLGCAYVCV
jgi:hypothetical protein